MQLPFTRDQFLDVFASYNDVLWPAALALWVASAIVCGLLPWGRRSSDRVISALLAIHWAWSALAYHAVFFTRINSAAWVFAALFFVQAGFFCGWGVVGGRLHFVVSNSYSTKLGLVLVAYALLYPVINLAEGLSFPRTPTFGVPCPTTILTAGLLMLVKPLRPRSVAIIPILWSVVGGSAAFLLGVSADLALLVAGAALGVHALQQSYRAPVSGAGRSF